MHSGKIDSGDSIRSAYEPFLLQQQATDAGPAPRASEPAPRASEPAPRASEPGPRHSRAADEPRNSFWRPSLAGIVWLTIGFGLCVNGLAVTVATARSEDAEVLFWTAIIVPFTVFTIILLAARPSHRLRAFIISAVGLYPSLVYRLSSPLVMGGFDEHLHQQELFNLLRGSGLFAPNPMLAVGPSYPGLELFTGAVVRLSGVPVILAMSLVALLCRLLLVLIIYNAALTVSPSRRVASLTVVFYAVSPQFYFFNSQFSYQTMALTLGLAGLFLLRRAQLTENQTMSERFSRAGTLALLVTVVTHHATSWIVLAFLASWAIINQRGRRRVLFRATAIMGVAVAAWTAAIENRLFAYMGPVFNADLQQVQAFIAGSGKRQIFGSAAGTGATPQWERAVLLAYALICTFAAITVACILISKALSTRDHMLGLLGVLCFASPVTLAVHFVPPAADLGDRASTFIFLPLALSCALVVMRDPRAVKHLTYRRKQSSQAFVSLIIVTSVAYMGGVMLGSGPDWQRIPGPYLVSADPRTQDAETLAAVEWAATHLPPGVRIVADRVPADLLESQARLWPVTVPEHGLEPAWLYFSPSWTRYQTSIVKGLRIAYIYVDQRLADSLPHVGFYFYPGESPEPRHISNQALTKFAHVTGIDAVYHHGPVTIYDTTGLGVQSQPEGFVGKRTMGLDRIGDGAIGALVADLFFLLRRRLAWLEDMFFYVGATGATVTLAAASIFVAGVLFEFCSMPGPSFSAGVIITVLIVAGAQRRLAGMRLIPRIGALPMLDPLVTLGIFSAAVGIAASIHAAAHVDVGAVETILREIAGTNRR